MVFTGKRERDHSFPICVHQRMAMEGPNKKPAIYKKGSRTQPGLRETKLQLLSHPVYGVLLRQPKLIPYIKKILLLFTFIYFYFLLFYFGRATVCWIKYQLISNNVFTYFYYFFWKANSWKVNFFLQDSCLQNTSFIHCHPNNFP